MNDERLNAYLERIGIGAKPPCSIEGLAQIQAAHLENVPFENLEIVERAHAIALDEDSLFDKIVTRRRGGICYELNFLYARALQALGFSVHLLGSQVNPTGGDYDHVFIMVEDPQGSDALWLTDVGFAYNYAAPLRFVTDEVQNDGRCSYKIEAYEADEGTRYKLMRLHDGEDDEQMLTFAHVYRSEEEFVPRATFYSTDDSSRFRKGPLVCIDGAQGRITLSMRHLIETKDGVRTEREIGYPDEFEELLVSVFKLEV